MCNSRENSTLGENSLIGLNSPINNVMSGKHNGNRKEHYQLRGMKLLERIGADKNGYWKVKEKV